MMEGSFNGLLSNTPMCHCAPLMQGYLCGLLGNTLMCTHFAGRGEKSAVKVEIIGTINNMLVLLQVKDNPRGGGSPPAGKRTTLEGGEVLLQVKGQPSRGRELPLCLSSCRNKDQGMTL